MPVIIGAVIGATSGAMMADQAGAQGFWEWAGYVGGGAVIGGVSGGAGGAIATGIGQSLNFAGAGLVGAGAGGLVGGAISGGGFAALGGGNIGEGIWKGAVSGLAGGLVGSYIGGEAGAFLGGATSGGVGSALYGGRPEDIAISALIGGGISWGSYQIQQEVAYRQYNRGSKPFGNLTNEGFRKLSVTSQRSFGRGKEASGWILDNGDVSNIMYGSSSGTNLQTRPSNAVANFHTHPNDPGTVQYHSLYDIYGEKDVNYVIGWSEIYKHDPKLNPLPGNWSSYSETYIYNTLIPSMISTFRNSLNPYPYYWFYFGH